MARGYRYSKKQGRMVKIETEKGFDYLQSNLTSGAYLISFFRAFPDRFLDLIESPNADFTLELPSRLILRSFAHYRKTMITSSRGLGKTYDVILSCMTDGVLYPGTVIRYYAPSQKQAAELARKAFRQIERNYPPLAELWKVRSETKDAFIIYTDFGSELAIGAIQGGNCHMLVGEEIGQETDPKFDFSDFESKVIPTCRLSRKINQKTDKTFFSPHYKYITNASRRQNPACYKYRADTMKKMIYAPIGDGFCADISWEMSVLFGIRDETYVEELKNSMTREDFLRQMCATYTGTAENPMVSDEDLSQSRTLKRMESKHCGDKDCIYIVGHDVSYEDGTNNAKCADVVLKLTRVIDEKSNIKRDKYKKDIVFVDNYPPPKDAAKQAERLKNLWLRYTMDGAGATYIVIDAWQYGKQVMNELIKPSADNIPLCCYQHLESRELEQENALPIIYPVKAGGTGTRDPDWDMIRYIRVEFQQGNIRMLTPDVLDGLEQYKRQHGIKDEYADASILQPYYRTNELAEQIQNLMVAPSGKGYKEVRVSKSIQRDSWSALKYAVWFASKLEHTLEVEHARKESAWKEEIQKFSNGNTDLIPSFVPSSKDIRSQLLSLRRR